MKRLIRYAIAAYMMSDELRYVKRKIAEIIHGRSNR